MKYRTLENKVELQQYWLIILFAILFFFVVEQVGLLTSFRKVAERSIMPFQQFGVSVVYLIVLPYRATVASYNSYQKIQDLELRYGEVAAQVGELENLRIENETLRKIAQATVGSGLVDKVITPILGYSQPILADTQNQFRTGDPVFIEGVFIGRVGVVSQNQAQLHLLSQLFTQPVLAKTETGASGLIFGNGKEVLLQEIPIEKEVAVGQKIFTIGQAGILPNWYIGRIKQIQRSEGSPTQKVLVDQGVSFFESKMVEVR